MEKTVVFAALNWGLGHATRLVPLINEYEQKGWHILLVSDGLALSFLKKELPQLETIDSGNPELSYASGNNLLGHLKQLLFPFLKSIKRDKQFVNKLLSERKIDLIISDNRYGFRHPQIESVIVTHQLQLAFPKQFTWARFIVQNKINAWLNAFDASWIIDSENHDFAGNLSNNKGLKIPNKYLGLQSRLNKENLKEDIDYLVVLSGLEPHRSHMENQVLELFKNSQKKVVIVGGSLKDAVLNSAMEYHALSNTKALTSLVNRAKCIISRAGYSSLMDWQKLQKKAIIIPTPGQPEQEYLAQFYKNHTDFTVLTDLKSISL